jgi:hypothetical protein
MSTSPIQDLLPLPHVGTVIEVLWNRHSDWWRQGTVVAWNPDTRRHEILYDDEPGEEAVEERFWGKGNLAQYRLVGM